jgi:hypothetical protein
MSAESGTNRWWENYLVRYLMPSIAGIVVVTWLCSQGGTGLRAILMLPPIGTPMDTASLTLIFLYGNLFCYIASYPILVFHVTRVVDFKDGRWPATYLSDGYLSFAAVLLASFIFFHWGSPKYHFYGAFVLATGLAAGQIKRLYSAVKPRIQLRGVEGLVSPAFGLAFSLSKRRGLLSVTEKKPSIQRKVAWRQDFMATYRHLREHGNSAFIFTLELILAVLVYFVIMKPGQTPEQQLGAMGALFAIWAAPSVFVHLLGQHLERQFSQYDRRVDDAKTTTSPFHKEKKPVVCEGRVTAEVTVVEWTEASREGGDEPKMPRLRPRRYMKTSRDAT